MDPDHGQPETPAESAQSPAIKRGQGLRLTTHTAPPDEPATPPDTPPAEPRRRGHGLRLSTQADASQEQEASATPNTPAEDGGRVTNPFHQASPAQSHGTTSWPNIDELIRRTPPRRLELAHGEVCYRQAGQGPPLLLIHGWGASSRYWLGTQAALADMRTCYALDLPGFGESPPLGSHGSIERLADVAIEFADALGIGQFDLNGHSFGGAVAIRLAARWPGRVRSLIVTGLGVRRNELERAWFGLARLPLDAAVRLWQPLIGQIEPWISQISPWSAKLLSTPPIPQLMAQWYLDSLPSDERLLREGIADFTRMGLGAHLACVASIGDPALVSWLSSIRAPALFIGGAADRVAPPDDMRAAAELTAAGRALTLERCGHVPMIERPHAYHAALRDFLG